jgi:hypothetical protein
MSLPVFLLALRSTVPNTFAHGAFHQLHLFATSPAFHNRGSLFLIRQQISKLWTNTHVLINALRVFHAQIMSLARQASLHRFFHRIASVNVAHSILGLYDHFVHLWIRESFFKIRELILRGLSVRVRRSNSFHENDVSFRCQIDGGLHLLQFCVELSSIQKTCGILGVIRTMRPTRDIQGLLSIKK